MDKRINELVDFTKEKYGLHDYVLHTFSIRRSYTTFTNKVWLIECNK